MNYNIRITLSRFVLGRLGLEKHVIPVHFFFKNYLKAYSPNSKEMRRGGKRKTSEIED